MSTHVGTPKASIVDVMINFLFRYRCATVEKWLGIVPKVGYNVAPRPLRWYLFPILDVSHRWPQHLACIRHTQESLNDISVLALALVIFMCLLGFFLEAEFETLKSPLSIPDEENLMSVPFFWKAKILPRALIVVHATRVLNTVQVFPSHIAFGRIWVRVLK